MTRSGHPLECSQPTNDDDNSNSNSDFNQLGFLRPLTQHDLNDLIRDLGLSKTGLELLASRLKNESFDERNKGKYRTIYNYKKNLLSTFSEEDNFVFCSGIRRVMVKN